MRFEFTVAAPTGRRDVAISAPEGTTPDALRRAVVDAATLCGLAVPPDQARLPRTGAVVGAEPGSVDGPVAAGGDVAVTAGRCGGRVRPLPPGRFVIGRAPDCDLVLEDASVSLRHVELDVGRRAVRVRDLGSTNGSRIDGNRLETVAELRPGQQLQLGNSAVEIWTETDEPRATLVERGDTSVVTWAPRPHPPSADVSIDLPDAAHAPIRHRLALAGALAPAAVGALIAWLTGAVQFLLFAALTPVMLVSTSLGERVQLRRSRRRAATERRRAMRAAQTDVAAALATERDRLRAAAPHPAAIDLIAVTPTSRLWERGANDPDFLVLRLGIATVASRCTTRCDGVEASAGTIAAAPVCVDLRAGPLGVCGPREVVRAVGRWLLGQAACLHSPSLLRISLVLPCGDAAWHWARWLPHLTLPPAADPDQLAVGDGPATPPSPSLRSLVLVDGTDITHPPGVGDLPHAVYLVSDRKSLPAGCAHVVTVQDPRTSSAELIRGASNDRLDIVLDQVDEAWAERVGRSLAPLSDGWAAGARSGTSPSLCELLGVGAPDPALICAHWQEPGAPARTVVGVGDEGPVWIDLVRDGPHCLIAGTTGAGKSELLRTLVAGLALRCPPTLVSFMLIDYKGGAAFAACADLPHVAGIVTDLDAHLTQRALRALHAELRRRERELAAAGAADIDVLHRTRPGVALPRLVVVVDEFATLAQELPDFVDGLVGVARRGRSLGLHLVLATQRPGRAITPEIKANTSLRIALRVTDAAESADVIDSPLAATISPATPGTAFLRTGDRLTAFRVARAGPAPTPGTHVELLGRWRQPLDATCLADANERLRQVVAAVAEATHRYGASRAPSPWLPPLLDWVADPGGSRGSSKVGLGLLDRPNEQRQDILDFDLSEAGAVVASGTTGSGRTTMLSGAALRAASQLSPDQLEIYVVDRAGELRSILEPLPHLASAVDAADPDLVHALLCRLTNADRPAAGQGVLPYRLLLVDDWDAVLGGAGERATASLGDAFTALLRTAAEHVLTVFVTGDRSLLAARWSFCAGMRFVLRLADRADYALAGIAGRDVPAVMPPGRALRADDGVEVQLFAPSRASGATALDAVAIGRSWPGRSVSRSAIRIRRLPDRVDLASCAAPPAGVRLGVGGDGAAAIAVDLRASGHLLVAGPPRSGRSTALLTVLAECLRTGLDVVVAAPHRSPVHERAKRLGVQVIGPETAAEAIDECPTGFAIVLVDDCEAFDDTAAGDLLTRWLRRAEPHLGAIVAGRTDELASAYRGVGAEARRNRSGVLLRPGPVDGELLGVRLARSGGAPGPGRGVLVGTRCWTAGDHVASEWIPLDTREPVPIQIALTGPATPAPDQPPAMCGYR